MNLKELQIYREQIIALSNKYNAENIRVFGSVARGDDSNSSDVDILVHFKEGASLIDESALDYELSNLLKCKVDLIADDCIRPEFQSYILKDAIPL